MFELADRNGVALPYPDVDAVRRAYVFDDLQSFLDVYYAGCSVLVTAEDFADLTRAYLATRRAPTASATPRSSSTRRPTPIAASRSRPSSPGSRRRSPTGERELGITSRLILCFLRHLSADAAMATLEAALPYREHIVAVGLDSSEARAPARRRSAPCSTAPAPRASSPSPTPARRVRPSTSAQALDLLHVRRIDHGVRCLEDPDARRPARPRAGPAHGVPAVEREARRGARPRRPPAPADARARPVRDGELRRPGVLRRVRRRELPGHARRRSGSPTTSCVRLARNSFTAAFLDDATRAAPPRRGRRRSPA